MKNTIRCCISCILPCGVLDVIRIVHSNGRVEEISGPLKAAEILKAYPKHVLKKPSTSSGEGCCPKIVVVPPDADLRRGKIYFLMPLPSAAPEKSGRSRRKKRPAADAQSGGNCAGGRNNGAGGNDKNNIPPSASVTNFLISDRYLTEILSEKVSTQRDRRRGRAGVWRPHLESICESTPSEV